MSWLTGLWRTQRAVVLVVCVLAAGAIVGAFIWPITDLIAAHDIGTITGPLRAEHLQDAREAVRTQMLTLGAGIFAFGALAYTARNFTLSRRTFKLTEQGQVTDRYTKAIEQLGSDKLDVRIGGIYALERVARDSARDHPTVMEVLAAFIREHSREQWPLPDEPGADAPARTTRQDVQAAVTVIGRRNTDHDCQPVILRAAHFTDADLTRANLTGANLAIATLTRATLTGADLTGVDLTGVDLQIADLTGADLTGAHLAGADLTGAFLPPPDPAVPDGWQRHTYSGRLQRADTGSGDAPTN